MYPNAPLKYVNGIGSTTLLVTIYSSFLEWHCFQYVWGAHCLVHHSNDIERQSINQYLRLNSSLLSSAKSKPNLHESSNTTRMSFQLKVPSSQMHPRTDILGRWNKSFLIKSSIKKMYKSINQYLCLGKCIYFTLTLALGSPVLYPIAYTILQKESRY